MAQLGEGDRDPWVGWWSQYTAFTAGLLTAGAVGKFGAWVGSTVATTLAPGTPPPNQQAQQQQGQNAGK